MPLAKTLAAFTVAGLAAGASADVISDFNASDEDWMVSNGSTPFNESITEDPDHFMTNGNGLGFITTPIAWRETAFLVAPEKFLGDQSAMFGGQLQVDRRFIHPDLQPDTMQVDYPFDLTITGEAGATILAVDLGPVSLVQWESFAVPFDSSGGWYHLDSGVAATDAEILSVLGTLEDVRVRANVRDLFGRVGVDNFSFVPGPGATGVLALAGLGCLRRRR